MSKLKNIIDQALQPGDRAFLERYRGREMDFFLERGRMYPEKLAEIFNAIANGTYSDLVVIGPRGGGKTMVVYDAANKRFIWDNDDVFAIGGSEAQARNGYAYVRQVFSSEKQIADGLQDELKTCATGPLGNWIKIAASSSKQVRGPHPGDPHEGTGWKAHGGVLIKDERDEMDDEISDAADGSMGAARPGMIITTSTMHRDDGGGISLMAEEAEARGAHVIKFDAFDVCEICTHNCAKCPGGPAFAGALYKGDGPGKKKLANGAPALPAITTESMLAWNEFKKSNAWPADEPAYCLGRAKQHRRGHLRIDDLVKAYKRSRTRENFEVEFCCRKRKGARNVVDGAALDRCLAEDVFYMPSFPEPVITIDWGLKGWCVLCLVQQQKDNMICVVDVRYEHMLNLDGAIAICTDWGEATGAYHVYADASHSYNNLDLKVKGGFEVHEVPFNKFKEMGAGWIRGIVERNQLRIRGKQQQPTVEGEKPGYVFWSDNDRELFNQIKGWRRDKNGKIVKKDDHGPDSLSCAAQHFAENFEWEPDFKSVGKRESSGW